MLEAILSFLPRAIAQGTPLLYGSTGEIITQKSGNMNLGIPGVMYVGGICGVIGAFLYEQSLPTPEAINPTLAVLIPTLFCLVGSLLMGLLFCFLTVTLRANQNVTGLALTTFGTGFGNFFGEIMGNAAGGYVSVGTVIKAVFDEGIPVLQDIPIIGKLLFSYNFLVYLALAIALVLSYFLSKTRKGLNLRAVGESPATADAAGIPVSTYKYLATYIGGGICGLGGLYIVMNSANGTGGVWVHNSISGYGWLAVAIVIFATWSPLKSLICSLVIGALSVLPYYYPITFIPSAIYEIFPYLATVAVLIMIIFRKKKNNLPPASLGLAYFREER